jgi:hypothetical protein
MGVFYTSPYLMVGVTIQLAISLKLLTRKNCPVVAAAIGA